MGKTIKNVLIFGLDTELFYLLLLESGGSGYIQFFKYYYRCFFFFKDMSTGEHNETVKVYFYDFEIYFSKFTPNLINIKQLID